jgi:Flp pilus assembly protein TadB
MSSRSPRGRKDQAHLVTEAPQSRAAEISQRERRYLVLMGIRVVCFVLTVVLFLNHLAWLALIPAVGAIALPYFAVVVANSRRPAGASDFRPYEPNLPQRYVPPDGPGAEDGDSGT